MNIFQDQKCQNGESESGNSTSSQATKDDKDKYSWLLCTNKNQHDLDKLMLTQIVTGDALEELDKKLNNCGVKFRLANAGSKKLNGHLNQVKFKEKIEFYRQDFLNNLNFRNKARLLGT